MGDIITLITEILGGVAVILIALYIISRIRKSSGKSSGGIGSSGGGGEGESQEELFAYLVKETENCLGKGNAKEASSIYNRLNHVYLYLDKSKKAAAKKKLDDLYQKIKQLKKIE